MKNRSTINIAGENYILLSEETDGYMQRVANLVNDKISQAKLSKNGISSMQALSLSACNLADDYMKAVEASENLRLQMKKYLEESDNLRKELVLTQKALDAALKIQKQSETTAKRTSGGKK